MMCQYVEVLSSVNNVMIFDNIVVLKVREDISKPNSTVTDIVIIAALTSH